jgi:60 kDa SS-A/Ro ribonucleoprotein
MAKNYLKQIVQHTPQNQPIPGSNQVPNSAGGYAWQVDEWTQLRRFLILGSEGGSYYASEQKLTVENANNVMKCIHSDGLRTVQEIVTISHEGRAAKNDPAIFALAMAASHGDVATRKAALDAIPKVCRTGTHLFAFAEYAQGMRGWGRAMRRGVAGWYKALNPRQLAYQVVKYRQRNGWTHTDTLRLAHPKPAAENEGTIYRWVTARADEKKQEHIAWTHELEAPQDESLAFIWAFEQAQKAPDVRTVLKLVEQYDLPREALPTEWLRDPAVWEALLPKMPMTAMIRNLATMTRNGFLTPMSDAENIIVKRLTDADLLRKARVHPIDVLSALRVYALGYSLRGQGRGPYAYYSTAPKEKEWTPAPRILDALDTAFELAFKNVEPTGKRHMLALDVSGSMASGMIAGVPGLTPRDGAAAMSMVTARTEQNYTMVAFQNQITPLNISAKMRLDDVIKATSGLPFGATDCAQPMLYALRNKLQVDVFVVYTDSETWFGNIHPVQALRDYRQKTGIPAQLIVVGMVANQFSIADPNDGGCFDVVGFDSSAPGLMADFVRGKI